MRWIRAVIAAVVVVLAVACSGGTVGTPVAELWDPCSIPSEAIAGAGVDPGIISSQRIDQKDNDWKHCSFRQDWFFVTVSATRNSFEEIIANARAVGSRFVPIGNRNAVIYQELVGTSNEACHVAYPSETGAIDFAVRETRLIPRNGDFCTEAIAKATALETFTPQ